VANCNTIELLKFAVQIAEQQQNPIIFKSEVLAAVTDLHWSTYGKKGHDTSLCMYLVLLVVFVLLILQFDEWCIAGDHGHLYIILVGRYRQSKAY
jgi:hypothetical protein